MKNRNYGLDLLKSVSMLMIVMLHILGVGGILASSAEGSLSNGLAWALEAANICAVNCFGLISGYVLSRGRYRRSRLLSLWLRVVLEGLLITAAFAVFFSSTVGSEQWLDAVLPILHDVYWYFTAYFCLFFFVPYINKMIAALSKNELCALSLSIVLLFTIINNIPEGDMFHLNSGYSFLWLLSLYLLGAFLRTCEIRETLNKYWFLLIFAGLVGISWVGLKLLGIEGILGYTSPTILLSGVSLLLFFRRLQVKSKFGQKAVSMLSRTSFGVYIIHTQPLVWTYLLANRFAVYVNLPAPLMVGAILLTAIAIYSAGTLIDWLAEKFFKLVRIDLLEAFVDNLGKSRKKQPT
ncbi:MAG: acyltransferase family protein [Oscillospiraceae bacterium]